jgi:ribosomal protein L40E
MRPKSSELSEEGITSNYSFVYSVPDNANHHFVYFNPYLVDATVTATLTRGGQSTTSAFSQIYSTTSASSQTYPYSSQTKPPQTYATQTASPSTTVPVSQIMTAVVAIAVVALVALFLYSRRGKQPKSTQPKYIQPAATIREMKPESGKTFCIECGKELPPQAKFCRNCGTKQP